MDMFQVRKGLKSDLTVLFAFIKALADYENAIHEVENNVETLERDGFGNHSYYEFFVAEYQNEIVGVALYFYNYSTWKGKVLYLEDIIVSEPYRRKGLGKMLFDAIIIEAQKMEVKRLSWQVLDWNEPAIRFYEKINTNFDHSWINCKLTKEQIEAYKF
jgi:GNAT superfamily N-acetyltransferase